MDHDSTGEDTGAVRPPRDPKAPGSDRPAPVRTVRLLTGDFLLTVNPVDGSEIEALPPGGAGRAGLSAETPRRTPEQRAVHERAGRPPVPPGPAAPRTRLLGRDDERERIARLLAQGRSLRVTGPRGSGRTALLEAVAADCADLAPDGVIRLNGHHRGPADLLHDLFTAVHDTPRHRPDRDTLLAAVAGIGAVVVLDDLEFGGSALDEFLAAAPECAFLLAATADTAGTSHAPETPPSSQLTEVALPGLDRTTSLELLRQAAGRPLAEDETTWAGDLWFESDGLPLRFVQAGALLRQADELREQLRDDPESFDAFAPPEGIDGTEVPLPTLGQGAAPAPLLASRLGDSARKALRFAVALGGEVPHQAHLPALTGDTHADSAIGELLGCGLISPAGCCYRLAAGVLIQLREKGYGDDSDTRAQTAAQHYTWWTGHPSVSPERAAAEADAVVAALTALVAGRDPGHASAAVLLARSAAPALAAGLHWGAWERVLRAGSEAARNAGEVAEEAYFHHELGILALCTGRLDRARTELETSIGMRGALADRIGTVVGRRALALVEDRENGLVPGAPAPTPALALEPPGPRPEVGPAPRPLALPPGPGAAATTALGGGTRPLPVVASGTVTVPVTLSGTAAPDKRRRGAGMSHRTMLGTRRNLVAVGAAAVLAVVVGTVVAIVPASQGDDPKGGTVRENGASVEEEPTGDPGFDDVTDDGGQTRPGVPGTPAWRTGGATTAPGGSASPSTGGPSGPPVESPAGSPSGPAQPVPSGPSTGPSTPPEPPGPTSSGRPPTSPPPSPQPPTSQPPTSEPSTAPPTPTTPSTPPDTGQAGGGDGGPGDPGAPDKPGRP
ncbi:ATP-binding protein [Streptomyces yaizuensis]|uniref:ATP-binding protein n=1 Tax=Streptomyces yaizuensis TaxID=2989713 RepID=A0ABQ5NWY9_9ACTN|nr:ATP-binding protein [Streptomyces sp. YSPA8]GLF94700.1 ATP-binding protein [Streptomyces sp. YSPA8]